MADLREYIPPFIAGIESKRSKGSVSADEWNEYWNLVRHQGNNNSATLGQLIPLVLGLDKVEQSVATQDSIAARDESEFFATRSELSAKNAALSASEALVSKTAAETSAISALDSSAKAIAAKNAAEAKAAEAELYRNEVLNIGSRQASVGYLETDFDAIDPRVAYKSFRKYTKVYDNVIEKIEAKISPTDVEPYITPDGKSVYWTDIHSSTYGYKQFTTVDPVLAAPGGDTMTAEQKETLREAYRVKVRKAETSYTKEKETWATVDNVSIPIKITGTGSGTPAVSALQIFNGIVLQNGQAVVYKDKTSYVTQYISPEGKAQWVKMTDDGIVIDSQNGYVDAKLRQPTEIDFSQTGKIKVTLQGDKTTSYTVTETATQLIMTNNDTKLVTTLKL